MAVYFFTETDGVPHEPPQIKIGYSNNITRRQVTLQTANSREIALMGHIKSNGRQDDRAIERDLHLLFADRRGRGEWFRIYPEDVITALHRYSSTAYLAVGDDAFEIVGYDRDGVPEFASSWPWGDFETSDFCPSCGWVCGWTYSENIGCEYCIKCGANEIDYEDAASFEGR